MGGTTGGVFTLGDDTDVDGWGLVERGETQEKVVKDGDHSISMWPGRPGAIVSTNRDREDEDGAERTVYETKKKERKERG